MKPESRRKLGTAPSRNYTKYKTEAGQRLAVSLPLQLVSRKSAWKIGINMKAGETKLRCRFSLEAHPEYHPSYGTGHKENSHNTVRISSLSFSLAGLELRLIQIFSLSRSLVQFLLERNSQLEKRMCVVLLRMGDNGGGRLVSVMIPEAELRYHHNKENRFPRICITSAAPLWKNTGPPQAGRIQKDRIRSEIKSSKVPTRPSVRAAQDMNL